MIDPRAAATADSAWSVMFSSNRHLALALCLSMIYSENRYPLFRIMLQPPAI
jgi:hypothetical protein